MTLYSCFATYVVLGPINLIVVIDFMDLSGVGHGEVGVKCVAHNMHHIRTLLLQSCVNAL